jgi:hypothetical protein
MTMRRGVWPARRLRVCCVTVIGLGAVAACGSDDPPVTDPGAVVLDAVVQYVDVEGGCWRLHTDSLNYEPMSLDAAFRQDGMAVRAAVIPRDDLGSLCMVGRIVEIDWIRRR